MTNKQHLADMLKSMATGDMEAAKTHFSKYSTEKSQEILSRGEATEEVVPEPAAPEAPEAPETPEVPEATDETVDDGNKE